MARFQYTILQFCEMIALLIPEDFLFAETQGRGAKWSLRVSNSASHFIDLIGLILHFDVTAEGPPPEAGSLLPSS